MKIVKTYLVFAVLSALTGVLLNIVWYLGGGRPVTINTLTYYMVIGLIFGTVVIVTLSLVIRKIRKPAYAYLINAVIEAVMMVLLFFYQNLEYSQWRNIGKWIILLAVLEAVSTVLTACWYKRMQWFNKKLEVKKKELEKP
jgi:uncharacterized membrane protein